MRSRSGQHHPQPLQRPSDQKARGVHFDLFKTRIRAAHGMNANKQKRAQAHAPHNHQSRQHQTAQIQITVMGKADITRKPCHQSIGDRAGRIVKLICLCLCRRHKHHPIDRHCQHNTQEIGRVRANLDAVPARAQTKSKSDGGDDKNDDDAFHAGPCLRLC